MGQLVFLRKWNRLSILAAILVALTVSITPFSLMVRLHAVRAVERFDPVKWPDTVSICSSITEIFRSQVAKTPALGTRPIVIRKAEDGIPRVNLDGLPEAYWVNLSAPDSTRWAQMVYQAGHEFGHIWTNPRVGGWFGESVCVALSHVALEEVAKEWRSHSNPRFVDYAPNFDSYNQSVIADYLKKFDIPSEGEVEGWIKSNLLQIDRQTRGPSNSSASREVQHVCSVAIKRYLRRHPAAWGALVSLGSCVEGPRVNFSKWRQLVTVEQRPLVNDLASLFGPLLDPGNSPGNRDR